MPYTRKTRDEYQLSVNYGQGWEHEISEDTRQEIKARAAEYRANCPQYPVKWRLARVPIAPLSPLHDPDTLEVYP
jgi:hypothetical protein